MVWKDGDGGCGSCKEEQRSTMLRWTWNIEDYQGTSNQLTLLDGLRWELHPARNLLTDEFHSNIRCQREYSVMVTSICSSPSIWRRRKGEEERRWRRKKMEKKIKFKKYFVLVNCQKSVLVFIVEDNDTMISSLKTSIQKLYF